MFDIGFSEIVVIGVVALIIFGPEDLPKVARIVGRMLGNFRRYVDQVKSELDQEIQASELKQLGQDIKESAQTLQSNFNDQMHAVESEWQAARNEAEGVAQEVAEPLRDAAALAHEATVPVEEPAAPAETAVEALPEVAEEASLAPAPAKRVRRESGSRKRAQASEVAAEAGQLSAAPEPVTDSVVEAGAEEPVEVPALAEITPAAAPVPAAPVAVVAASVPAQLAVLADAPAPIEQAPSQEKNDDQLDLFGLPIPSAAPHKA